MQRREVAGGLALLLAGQPTPGRASGADVPAIAAAADLQAAMPGIVAAFTAATRQHVRVTYGSSGNFAQQILNGAPFELFLSADEALVARLVADGRTRDSGRLYAIGRVGVLQPKGSPVRADPRLEHVAAALTDGRLRRFAIANPEHAPYGRAAREALQTAGLWEQIRPRLVLGENAAQATQFALSGAVQGGIVPLPLARAPEVAARGSFALIDAGWHAPLRQRMVLMRSAGRTATAFYGFMSGAAAQAILRRFGFEPPPPGRA
jgi:molybdate transport system substrate-binding protein